MSEKTSIRMYRYDVPPDQHSCGGTFFLDTHGTFAVVSDYGNYGYEWEDFGWGDFRAFLVKADPKYIRRKLDPGLCYDGEATLADVKSMIESLRSSGDFSDEKANEELELLDLNNDLRDEGDLIRWIDDTCLETSELIRSKPRPDSVSFITYIFPRFIEMLKAELAQEADHAD